jgi:hypothetical protein
VASNFTPIYSPTYVVPSTGIYVGAFVWNDPDETTQPGRADFNMLLSVVGAAENDPVTLGIDGSTTVLSGESATYSTGSPAESYGASVTYFPGADYFINVTTSVGAVAVTLMAPGTPVYSSKNTFTWSPEGNSDYAAAAEDSGSLSIYQSANYSADIDSPYTFPAAAFPVTGIDYTLLMMSHNSTNQISGADSESYFYITSRAITVVGE